jgi:divalent metal cation (Fe/Co/Zn/Cd) transporter
VHKTTGVRDPAVAFPLPGTRDDAKDRREANRAVAVSAIGLAATGLIELQLAVLTGSEGLLGDAIHNLSDVSTSAVVVIWASAAFAGAESGQADNTRGI